MSLLMVIVRGNGKVVFREGDREGSEGDVGCSQGKRKIGYAY